MRFERLIVDQNQAFFRASMAIVHAFGIVKAASAAEKNADEAAIQPQYISRQKRILIFLLTKVTAAGSSLTGEPYTAAL